MPCVIVIIVNISAWISLWITQYLHNACRKFHDVVCVQNTSIKTFYRRCFGIKYSLLELLTFLTFHYSIRVFGPLYFTSTLWRLPAKAFCRPCRAADFILSNLFFVIASNPKLEQIRWDLTEGVVGCQLRQLADVTCDGWQVQIFTHVFDRNWHVFFSFCAPCCVAVQCKCGVIEALVLTWSWAWFTDSPIQGIN